MTSHHRACSTVWFTYSKDWCSFWIRSLMASASAWTEALASDRSSLWNCEGAGRVGQGLTREAWSTVYHRLIVCHHGDCVVVLTIS